jgi:hypothetical protein
MTQTKPNITWWWDYLDAQSVKQYDNVGKINGVGTLNMWDLGVVRAGNEAIVDETLKTFYIWNNKGGSEVAQTMTNCELTIRDGNYTDGSFFEGNADSVPVLQRWIEARTVKSVKDSSGNETFSAWTPLGLTTDGKIAKINFEALGNGVTASVDGFAANEIGGAINTGTFVDDAAKNNYAKVQMRMKVPGSAEAGEIAFIARVYYSSRVV